MFRLDLVTPPKIDKIYAPDGSYVYVDTQTGRKFESVTTYLGRTWYKDGLEKWKKKLGEKKALAEQIRTLERGKYLHTMAENYFKTNKIEITQSFSINTMSFMKLKPLLDRVNDIKLIETPLFSHDIGLAGTPDIIAKFDGKFSVIDIKGSTRMKKRDYIVNYFLQTACYALMFKELFGILPEQAVILMSSEEVAHPQLFLESMDNCVKMLYNYMKDPVKFQEIIRNFKARS